MLKKSSIQNSSKLRSIYPRRLSKGHIWDPNYPPIVLLSSALRVLVVVGSVLRRHKKALFLIETGS